MYYWYSTTLDLRPSLMKQPLSLEMQLLIEFKGTIDFLVSTTKKIRYFTYSIAMVNFLYE